MPMVRYRPKYPRLKHDQTAEKVVSGAGRGAQCAKYFSQYSQQILTSGIMAVWCTHSILYVIYDFACTLGPYCMTREGGFFANTDFVIDRFHMPGHTKCAPACFLKTYATAESKLKAINSNAAECVSYMGQYRATLYMKTFISIYNQGPHHQGQTKATSQASTYAHQTSS
ncbi:hypothetical protein BDQ17DRAFT_1393378 [Cyathus striatus]|nr:hypothetical protein BDQ17DRAFT_1393378 [Cyathus striatus]